MAKSNLSTRSRAPVVPISAAMPRHPSLSEFQQSFKSLQYGPYAEIEACFWLIAEGCQEVPPGVVFKGGTARDYYLQVIDCEFAKLDANYQKFRASWLNYRASGKGGAA